MNQPRKGARSRAEIEPRVLAAINRGEMEALSLSEGLAVDFAKLMTHVFPELRQQAKEILPATGIVKRMQQAGEILCQALGSNECEQYLKHPSDTVRGWIAYALAADPRTKFATRLKKFKPLADDAHFGVREWAWMALRPHIAQNLTESLQLLTPWTLLPQVNLRRFAIEITRPRGVWSAHITKLKEAPELALDLLENVNNDSHKYVQDSCANWLNDASKTQPQFVRQVTSRWQQTSPTKATQRICTRALRSLGK